MISTLPPMLIQWLASGLRGQPGNQSVWNYALFAFVVVAISEEASKFMMLRVYAFPKKQFKGALDGIIYAVMIAMGFATLENIEYVEKLGMSAGISRFFLSVPAHAAFAVLMGYNVGLAKTAPHKSWWLMWKGLLIAVFFHGSFDFFLFLQQNEQVKRYVSEGLLSFGAFATFYIAIRLAMRTIRLQKTY
jgi:RsiW-degrading membrane proteinase PrsW (M82 family)